MTERATRREREGGPHLRTYSHLSGVRRVPDDYDLTTTGLHYYVGRGFEVKTPISAWYERYQAGSPLRCSNWDLFADPERLTYARYTGNGRQREAHVDGILRSIDDLGYDATLRPEWLDLLDGVLGPLRFPLHGLQMVASYAGSMAPGGRVTVALAFQAGHEMRRIQRLAYRMVQLRGTRSDFGTGSRARWQEDAVWQPLRKLVERLLVTYDFGESLVALNLCVKPMIDSLFGNELAGEAVRRGDPLLAEILTSLGSDSKWQRDWTRALVDVLVRDRTENADVIRTFTSQWLPDTEAALAPFASLFEKDGSARCAAVAERVRAAAEPGESR